MDRRSPTASVAIEVDHVCKTFRIPVGDPDSPSGPGRLLRPREQRELRAVRDVSFEIGRGEFFGIVGRNGSGKSTLLKIMAGIYRPGSGRVRASGRIAPFIELGVGFNPELTARENVELGGVIMGLTRREARRRLDAVLDFAQLRDYVELKVKNYSSGMMVRLAFAIMIQAEAEIMLIDEVLAVGDASFAQRCMDVFYERRAAGTTIVLVTHNMEQVETLCHRAMVLHHGSLIQIGDPQRTALEYYRRNLGSDRDAAVALTAEPLDEAATPAATTAGEGDVDDPGLSVIAGSLVDGAGLQRAGVSAGDPIRVRAQLQATRDLRDPVFVIQIVAEAGFVVGSMTEAMSGAVAVGRRIELAGEIENLLVPGHYELRCTVREAQAPPRLGAEQLALASFAVHGPATRHSIAALPDEVELTVSR